MSLTWYTWLEQGRNINVSREVLGGIARALALAPAERAHLFRLAGEGDPCEPEAVEEEPTATDDVSGFVELLAPNPAYAMTPWFDLVAWNRPAAALMGLPRQRPAGALNALAMMFEDERWRVTMPDWEREARWIVGLLRAASAQQLANPRFGELIRHLSDTSELFRAWWTSHDVEEFTPSVRRLWYPEVGELRLNYMRFVVEGRPGLSVVVHFAPPGSPEAERLERLVRARSGAPVPAPPAGAPVESAGAAEPVDAAEAPAPVAMEVPVPVAVPEPPARPEAPAVAEYPDGVPVTAAGPALTPGSGAGRRPAEGRPVSGRPADGVGQYGTAGGRRHGPHPAAPTPLTPRGRRGPSVR
ncbi:hypothetical protein FHU37_005260 [Allostreptomyces psammosilenae]|uniref:MmyB-like transcription regulator ligand binding domain-containing protein n=1 Tax=Allostreptomyces psammosilenae TaxID=1892865 RepID=A0A853ACF7_9ACTN|nr:hypothetical protein [Allostreptomyces psammosilenae]